MRAFERAFADHHGANDAVAVSSCTTGLHLEPDPKGGCARVGCVIHRYRTHGNGDVGCGQENSERRISAMAGGFRVDLTEAEWARLRPLIRMRRPEVARKTDMRAAMNAIFYLLHYHRQQ